MNIIITGASSGLGAELAKYYSHEATTLHLIARRKDRLIELKNSLKCEVKIYVVDVSDFKNLEKTITTIVKNSDYIDMVIANAGVSLGHNSEFCEFENFKKLFDINFLSIHALLTPIIPKMQLQHSGKIVIISSLASIITMPSSIAYSTSKRALNSYCEGVRNLVAPDGVEVINILPGFIKSEMTDKNSFKMPFLLETSEGVKRIVNAIKCSKKEYKFPKRFYIFIKLVSLLPLSLKDRVIQTMHKKK
ncbi:MAG: SDR family NAD(P)-dependent oxidoreductase [Helicobacteraceae bacterium]|nr:SDR family NAD(P)-dependent oxidoreductase [Helicobacteraceae bacterium]